MKTKDNLKAAFAGESQANRKYLAFAKKAEQEGYPVIAHLFRAVAEAETVHAHAHLRNLGGIGDTLTNLREAKAGEDYEISQMYPDMVATAEAEGETRAAQGMRHALAVEKVHSVLYGQAIAALEAGKDLDHDLLHVCEICGHTVFGEPEGKCPICGAKQSSYKKVA
ncbi:MAG: rubrerythrin family protein [Magnetococcales bacterium]|nr:rubrerythrin family protein [Magnetococcales bacterium]MBF0148531.1 rubrerythrin family protein [Magnetococcales bacterium]MBF0172652.1 rubrerythrin family protein [Magnetococcales bacterium]MBF0346502.1 rubrerythrin family protein [Magnetococcales bacterium]MBF0629777.1 rubrerythrin family protein [Magnetococcales bacterium]